jgi:hypothetical protein
LEEKNEIEPMFLSFFIPVGVFLIIAARRPSEHRSMIALAAWWSISHGVVMAIQTVEAWIHGVHRNFKRVLHRLARDLELPKMTFQVIRRTIATLAQKKGTVKDVQGVLRHSRTATTTDVYMQEIPESVQAMINSINRELRKSRPARESRANSKRTADAKVSPGKPPQHSVIPERVIGNLTPNDTKSERSVAVSN